MKIFLFIVVFLFGANEHDDWSSKLTEKVNATIKKTYTLEHFDLEAIEVDQSIEDAATLKVNNHLFKVTDEDTHLGYVYVSQAPSMKNVFDYIVLFNPELIIVNSKVLIYREDYGRQIGTKRWLSQFFGMNQKDRPVLGKEIDGISGSTISSTNMTKAVNEVLATVDYLDGEKIFN